MLFEKSDTQEGGDYKACADVVDIEGADILMTPVRSVNSCQVVCY
jgi:hypothetical protein